jgi:ABC-2 type transport system ATP-binding protein
MRNVPEFPTSSSAPVIVEAGTPIGSVASSERGGTPAKPQGKVILNLEGVSMGFRSGPPWHRRSIEVLQDLSMQVSAGELVGLVGENGSGKSTLMQLLVGLLGRDSGTISCPSRIGYCPQQPLLWERLKVAEHFELFASAYGMEATLASASSRRLMVELDFLRFSDFRVERLSGGTRQKLNLALALMHDPELLLLDEPYSGFDWETYLRFWDMAEQRRDAGMGIMIVSHLLTERERLDRVYELRNGRVRLL